MTGLTKPAFDLDQFVADCRHALSEDMPQKAVCEVMARALADAASVRDTMAVPRAEIRKLYAGPDLVVLNAIWAPGMSVPPHNHNMWAVIGLYDGREDNIFWRRISDAPGGRIEAAGAKSLSTRRMHDLGFGYHSFGGQPERAPQRRPARLCGRFRQCRAQSVGR